MAELLEKLKDLKVKNPTLVETYLIVKSKVEECKAKKKPLEDDLEEIRTQLHSLQESEKGICEKIVSLEKEYNLRAVSMELVALTKAVGREALMAVALVEAEAGKYSNSVEANTTEGT